MFDFLRNLTKSAEEKRQEMLASYVDGSLSPAERQQFEEMLAQDPGLQAELEQQQTVRQMLSQLPSRRVPRNFTLDPAKYGRPAKQPFVQYYPALRAATVMTAVLLFFVVGLNLFTFSRSSSDTMTASNIAMEPPIAADGAADDSMDMAEEEGVEEAMEAEAEEAPMEEAAMDESATSEEAETQALATAATVIEEEMEAAEGESDSVGNAAAPSEPTATALPTATQSVSPRIEATSVPDRAMTAESAVAEATELAFFAETAEPPVAPDMDSEVSDTAVAETEPQSRIDDQQQLINLITMVQIGLLLLLIALVVLTIYARRQF